MNIMRQLSDCSYDRQAIIKHTDKLQSGSAPPRWTPTSSNKEFPPTWSKCACVQITRYGSFSLWSAAKLSCYQASVSWLKGCQRQERLLDRLLRNT